MSEIRHPLINGKRHQHSSMEIQIGVRRFIDVKSIDYEDELKPGKVRGTKVRVQGRTRGIYDATASMEVYRGESEELMAELTKGGQGFGEQEFDIVINIRSPGMPLVTDEIIGCRVTKVSSSSSEDENGLADKFELDVMRIRRNGKDMVVED